MEPLSPRFRRRPFVTAGIVTVALAVVLGVLIVTRHQLGIDQSWMADVLGWRTPAGEAFGRLFDFLGWTSEWDKARVRDLPDHMLQGLPQNTADILPNTRLEE